MAALRQQSRNSQYYSNSQSQPNSRPRRHASTASTARKHFVAATGEFVGTFMFLFIAFLGHSMSVTQAATSVKSASGATAASSEQVVFIALSYGFSLLVSAWTLYRVSGGLFNPAVTLGEFYPAGHRWENNADAAEHQVLLLLANYRRSEDCCFYLRRSSGRSARLRSSVRSFRVPSQWSKPPSDQA